MIDIVKYVEETFGIELLEYQKVLLRDAYSKYKDTNLDLPVGKLLKVIGEEDND